MAHRDELLGSVLARFRDRLGIHDDKVVLEILFGSRNVVPSAILQGHVEQLLAHVGHLWKVDALEVVDQHTVLPLFHPFVSEARYLALYNDLIKSSQNPVTLRSGFNASVLQWSAAYKVCPICWHNQLRLHGYAYWQRLFQCPGVECCPDHGCSLVDTCISLESARRHQFVGTRNLVIKQHLAIAAPQRVVTLAGLVNEILLQATQSPEIDQWSSFYKWLARSSGNFEQRKTDHDRIRRAVTTYWGEAWLDAHGIGLNLDNNWLLAIFRSHRRPFTYLQHFVVWMALLDRPFTATEIIGIASQQRLGRKVRAGYFSSKADERRDEYRAAWLSLLATSRDSLKAIRATSEGARVFSWLYRFDHEWLQTHKPTRMKSPRKEKVSWPKRDRVFVKKLLNIERETCENLACPRRTLAWFARQIDALATIEKHIGRLPLCDLFFERYVESVDEFQTRRLAQIMIDLIGRNEQGLAVHAIERLAGLSKERCRLAARTIIEQSIPAWQDYQDIPSRNPAREYRRTQG